MGYCFFTEHQSIKLNDQVAGEGFGAIDANRFRVNNLFTSAAALKAFAVTSGRIMVQSASGVTNTLNLVLKPDSQPSDLGLPKIDYIIYKGIDETSIMNIATKIIKPTSEKNTDLTSKIQADRTTFNQLTGGTDVTVDASEALGYIQPANIVLADTIDSIFYNQDITLVSVKEQDYLGDFNISGKIGIMIVFEKIGFQLKFEHVLQIDTILTHTLPANPTAAQTFRHKHDKEEVLAFMDSAAFYGALCQTGFSVYNGSSFEFKDNTELDYLYDNIIKKHLSKNKLYLDIRNEYYDSFNYYENYSDTIKWSLDATNTLVDVNYYRANGWPLLMINDDPANPNDVEFTSGNTDKLIKLAFPQGDNLQPTVYLKKALIKPNAPETDTYKKFSSTNLNDTNNFTYMHESLSCIKNNAGNIISNYYQIHYIKRADSAEENNSLMGKSLRRRRSVLDNLFPIFNVNLPFAASATPVSNIKIFEQVNFVDKEHINQTQFVTNIGLATDANYKAFVSYPVIYALNEPNDNAVIPLITSQFFNNKPFLENFDKIIVQDRLKISTHTSRNIPRPFFRFEVPAETLIEDNKLKNFDFTNINIISITNAQYTTLQTLKDTHFGASNPYKIYLSIANTNYLDVDSQNFSINVFVLTGLRENTVNNTVEAYEYITNIEFLASDRLYN
ncbi:MAG TPA: hypothetical protein VEC12_09875 [Bacteroidia bacterium]|nr:hypothetical protein [Bacteroidia bacterium]